MLQLKVLSLSRKKNRLTKLSYKSILRSCTKHFIILLRHCHVSPPFPLTYFAGGGVSTLRSFSLVPGRILNEVSCQRSEQLRWWCLAQFLSKGRKQRTPVHS